MHRIFRLILLPVIGLALAACAHGQPGSTPRDEVLTGQPGSAPRDYFLADQPGHATLMALLRQAADPAACPLPARPDNRNTIRLYQLDAQHRLAKTVCWQGQRHETWFLAVLDQNDQILASYANADWQPEGSVLYQYERDEEKILDTCPNTLIWADGAFHLAYAAQCNLPD